MKLYIISNRLPVKAAGSNGTFVFSRSEGGLATGLDSLQTFYEKHWIGWPGVCTDNEKDRQEMNEKLQEMNFHRSSYRKNRFRTITKDIAIVPSGLYATIFTPIPYIKNVFGTPISRSTNFSAMKFAG